MIVSTFLVVVAMGLAAPDDNVCVPAEDGRSWVCGTRANPPESSGALPEVETQSLPPRDDPQLEVFAIPDASTTRTRAIPGSPLLQDGVTPPPASAHATQAMPDSTQPSAPTAFAGDGKFTLLLASLTTVPDLLAFAEDFEVDLQRAARVPILVHGNVRHVLVFGRFPSAEAARQAIPNLPYVLQSMRPTAVSLDRYANDPVPLVDGPEATASAPPSNNENSGPLSAADLPNQAPEVEEITEPVDLAGPVAPESDIEPPETASEPQVWEMNSLAEPSAERTGGMSSPTDVPARAESADAIVDSGQQEPETEVEAISEADALPISDPAPDDTRGPGTRETDDDVRLATDVDKSSVDLGPDSSSALAANNPFALPETENRPRTPRESRTTVRPDSRPEPSTTPIPSSASLLQPGSWRGAQDFAREKGGYTVQMAVRPNTQAAATLAAGLDLDPSRTYFVPYRGNVLVLVGRYATITDAKRALEQLPTLDNPPWVRRAKPLMRQ